jgi:hypothetical protein
MKRHLMFLFALVALLACVPVQPAQAEDGHGHGHGRGFGHGFGRGFGRGFGSSTFIDNGCNDFSELYRQLYNNLPFYALHPPVYYSYPVPRTYGYSPFAYWPCVMTPDPFCPAPVPLTIDNPYVPSSKPASTDAKPADRSAATSRTPEPLVIINPFITQGRTVASNAQ